MGSTVNLVVVVVETGDVRIGELGNLARRSADTTANVQHLHALLDADLRGKVVLVAGNGLVERLAGGESAEVEALAPSVLVDVGGEVVVAIREENTVSLLLERRRQSGEHDWGGRTAWSMWHTLLSGPTDAQIVSNYSALLSRVTSSGATCSSVRVRLGLGLLVVEVLEVLVNSQLLGILVLGHHGSDASLHLRGLAVERLVEVGITSVVLLFEGNLGRRHCYCEKGLEGWLNGVENRELRESEAERRRGGEDLVVGGSRTEAARTTRA